MAKRKAGETKETLQPRLLTNKQQAGVEGLPPPREPVVDGALILAFLRHINLAADLYGHQRASEGFKPSSSLENRSNVDGEPERLERGGLQPLRRLEAT